MKFIAILIALIASTAHGYFGYFDPQPTRSVITITFVDSQLPGPQCVAEAGAMDTPLIVFAVGCAIYAKDMVILPISPGPGWINGASGLATPNAILAHEVRHLFDGDYHGPVPWSERVRSPEKAAGAL